MWYVEGTNVSAASQDKAGKFDSAQILAHIPLTHIRHTEHGAPVCQVCGTSKPRQHHMLTKCAKGGQN